MKNKKIIVLIVSLLILIALAFIIKSKIAFSPTSEIIENSVSENKNATSTSSAENVGSTESSRPSPTNISKINPLKDEAWNLFQTYLEFNKNKNLEGVKSVVYKISNVCNTEKPSNDCINRMSLAYFYGAQLNKDSFTNVWGDNKQIILATDFYDENEASTTTRYRTIIYFVRDNNNNLKMLSFNPINGSNLNNGNYTTDEIKQKLVTYTEDNDQDGMADYQEQCKDTKENSGCVKTDSTLRDTDGDGLWDGIEFIIGSL